MRAGIQGSRSERDRQHRERPAVTRSESLRAGAALDPAADFRPRPRQEDLLLAAEAGAPVPQGMNRCIVVGGGLSGTGEEFGLLRVRTPRVAQRTHQNIMPCSVNGLGEVGILRLPDGQRYDEPTFGWKKTLDDEDAHNRREYQDEIERSIRLRLEETERRKFAQNSTKMANLFNRLGNKWATIQDEKIAERRQQVEQAKFELWKHAARRAEQAATRIAAWYRGILSRRHVRIVRRWADKKLAEKVSFRWNKKRRRLAATCIQRFYRGWKIRMRYKEQRRFKREDWLSGRVHALRQMEVTIYKARTNHRFRKRCGAAKIATVLARLVRHRLSSVWKRWAPGKVGFFIARAIVRIQAWYRGIKYRRELRELQTEMHVGPDDLEFLRRIRREAFHAKAALIESEDMIMVTRTLKRREAEEHEQLKRGLRNARDVARAVEVGLWREVDHPHEVPLQELTDYLEAKRLKAEDDHFQRHAENDILSTRTTYEARQRMTRLEQELREVEEDKREKLGLSRVRAGLRQIHRDMAEVQDATAVFSKLQDFKRTVDFRFT